DGNQNIAYTNPYGQVMLKSFKDTTTSDETVDFYEYDAAGRVIMHAAPSAVLDYDDTYADLLHWNSTNYALLSDTDGLLDRYGYASTTTATSTAPGDVAGL